MDQIESLSSSPSTEASTEQPNATRQHVALTVRILTSSPGSIQGQMLSLTTTGLCMLSPKAIPLGAAIRIDRPDGFILGEACQSSLNPDGSFSVAILFHEILGNLGGLEPLLRGLRPQDREPMTTADPRR